MIKQSTTIDPCSRTRARRKARLGPLLVVVASCALLTSCVADGELPTDERPGDGTLTTQE